MRTSKRAAPTGSEADYDRWVVERLWPPVDHILTPAARAQIGAGADEADRTGTMQEASLNALRDAGYFGFPVPVDFEGGGGSLLECCALQRALARLDPALAVAVNMHLFSVGVVVEHWKRERDASWALLEAIATQDRIVASGFAEPGLGGSILRSTFAVERVDDGWLVSGVKVPCSLATSADLVCFQFQEAETGPEALLVGLMPTDAPGICAARSWDGIGMRGSASDSLRFEACHVPDDLVFHRCAPGFDADEVFAAGLNWFALTTTATYLGVAAAAVAEATAMLDKSRLHHLDASRSELPTFQAAVGDVVARLAVIELSNLQLARLVDDDVRDARALLPLGLALKKQAAETTVDAVNRLVELVGASAYGTASLLGRLWRDVQASRFHPPTRFATDQILGRWHLGLPFTFEVMERPAR